jgi:hypothetical protein
LLIATKLMAVMLGKLALAAAYVLNQTNIHKQDQVPPVAAMVGRKINLDFLRTLGSFCYTLTGRKDKLRAREKRCFR